MRALLSRVFLVVIFPFIILNMSNHFLLACRVFPEESADNLTGILLMLFVAFPLLLLIFYFCLLFLSIWLTCVLAHSSLGFCCTWLCLLNLGDFSIIGKFSDIISSNILSGPFSTSSFRTPITWILMHLILSQSSLKLSSFLFILFSFVFFILFHSCEFHHSVFQLTYPFFCLIDFAIDSFYCIFHLLHLPLCLFFISSGSSLNISCIFLVCASILFPRFWILFTVITLNSFSGRLSIST